MQNLPLEGKQVLLLAPPFYSLHNQIIEGFRNLGASVGFIPDIVQAHNPLFGTSSLKRFKRIYYRLLNPNRKYLTQFSNLLTKNWDYFVCIDGYTFDDSKLSLLKKANPNIKCYLYLWDSLNFFNFSGSFSFFDKVYSFDPIDSESEKINYLPLYWIKESDIPTKEKSYDFSFVGTMHTDRYRILKSIANQCKDNNWNYNFKLIVNRGSSNWIDTIRYFIYKHINTPSAIGFVDEYRLKNNLEKCEFVYFDNLSSTEVQNIINSSKCIIDIANPLQTGITNRTIASLAAGKKVLTTVKLIDGIISKHPNISYLDRKNPIIQDCMMESSSIIECCDSKCDQLQPLFINNWLQTILELNKNR